MHCLFPENLFLLPLLPGLGAGELESGVNIKVAHLEIFPLVRDLIRTVVSRGVDRIHHSYRGQMSSVSTYVQYQNIFTVIVPFSTVRNHPQEVVYYWVGVEAGRDELSLVRHPEWDDVFPE